MVMMRKMMVISDPALYYRVNRRGRSRTAACFHTRAVKRPNSPTEPAEKAADHLHFLHLPSIIIVAPLQRRRQRRNHVVLFVAFVCFAVAARPPYIAATCVEFIVTLALVLLYLLKLNKTITFFFWPLIDVFNSVFAATFILIISIMALSTYTVQGTLAGGIASLVAVVLWFVDGFHLFKKITFNQPRGAT
uniref:MARVEL domain-containing protein n=1 Tax=Pygocentrus nattereri TaxID=42514 RepID=A0AAR2K6R1_PYGNA